MSHWRRHGEKIYLDNKAFACIVPGLTIDDEREFDTLIDCYEASVIVEAKDSDVDNFKALDEKLKEAPTIAEFTEALLTKLKEIASKGGWNMISVKQIEEFDSALDLPRLICRASFNRTA